MHLVPPPRYSLSIRIDYPVHTCMHIHIRDDHLKHIILLLSELNLCVANTNEAKKSITLYTTIPV